MRRIDRVLLSVAWLSALCLLTWGIWKQTGIGEKIDGLLSRLSSHAENGRMVVKVMKWTSGGIEQELHVTKLATEDAEQFAARCAAELEAQLEVFPKDT